MPSVKEEDEGEEGLNSQEEEVKGEMSGDVSNIEKIYQHVLDEGKKVNDSLKSVNEKVSKLGKGFLSFFKRAETFNSETLLAEHVDF